MAGRNDGFVRVQPVIDRAPRSSDYLDKERGRPGLRRAAAERVNSAFGPDVINRIARSTLLCHARINWRCAKGVRSPDQGISELAKDNVFTPYF